MHVDMSLEQLTAILVALNSPDNEAFEALFPPKGDDGLCERPACESLDGQRGKGTHEVDMFGVVRTICWPCAQVALDHEMPVRAKP